MNSVLRNIVLATLLVAMVQTASGLPLTVEPGVGVDVENLEGDCVEQTTTPTCCEETAKTGSNPLRDEVRCGFECPFGSELAISAVSQDEPPGTPDVWGEVSCSQESSGNKYIAECMRGPRACAGASVGVVPFNGDGGCWADSNDAWADPTTVVCFATMPVVVDCSFREGLPSNEELIACGYTISCQNLQTGGSGHQTGVSFCRVEDPDGQAVRDRLCVHVAGVPIYCEDVRLPLHGGKGLSAQAFLDWIGGSTQVIDALLENALGVNLVVTTFTDAKGEVRSMICEAGACYKAPTTCIANRCGVF